MNFRTYDLDKEIIEQIKQLEQERARLIKELTQLLNRLKEIDEKERRLAKQLHLMKIAKGKQ